MNSKAMILSFFVVIVYSVGVESYGRVLDPVHRGSAWRLGFNTPINYNDQMNQCGGFSIQHSKNKGECGVCGDNFADSLPQDNQNTGLYGTGTIVKTYKQEDSITVIVELTANLGGYFKFSICDIAQTVDGLETEECFKDLELMEPGELEDDPTIYKLLDKEVGKREINLRLPANLICKHCSLRWQYTAANNWGICEDGTGKLGCGPQETFRTCSDVTIIAKS